MNQSFYSTLPNFIIVTHRKNVGIVHLIIEKFPTSMKIAAMIERPLDYTNIKEMNATQCCFS